MEGEVERLREANARISRLLMRARIELRDLSRQQAQGASSSAPPPSPARPPFILPRPSSAVGTFLRIITVNDVYKLDRYPSLATAIRQAQA